MCIRDRSRANGGAGIIIFEALCVTPEARLTDSQLGIWSDEHIEGLKQIVDSCHKLCTYQHPVPDSVINSGK